MTWIALFVIVFGVLGLTELIRHDVRLNEILIRWESGIRSKFSNFWFSLLICGFCLSHWTTGAILLLWFLVPYGEFAVIFFAVVRLANLINDIFHRYSRSPDRPEF